MGAGVRPLCCRRWRMELCSMRRGALRSPRRCIPPKNSVPHPAEPEPPGASRASRTPGREQSFTHSGLRAKIERPEKFLFEGATQGHGRGLSKCPYLPDL